MIKDLFFVWCLVMVISSSNAQFIDFPHQDGLSEPRFPLLDPAEQLALKNIDRKILLSKLKNRLKEKKKNTAAPVASTSESSDKQFGGGGLLGNLIQSVIAAIVSYAEAVLASLFPDQFSTVTRTVTLTSFFTCTKSTTACAGRRRRAIIKDLLDDPVELEHKFISLASSLISNNNGSAAEEGSFNFDDSFSDYFESYDDLPLYDPTQLEGSIEMDPIRDPSTPRKRLALKMGKDKEMRSQLMNIRQLPPGEAAVLVRQLGLNTVRTTVTVITSTTVTSYPACSSQGNLVQCT